MINELLLPHLPKLRYAELWRKKNPDQHQQELKESNLRMDEIAAKSIITGGFNVGEVMKAMDTTYNQLKEIDEEASKRRA